MIPWSELHSPRTKGVFSQSTGSRLSCSLSFLSVVLFPCYIFSDISSCLSGVANFSLLFFERPCFFFFAFPEVDIITAGGMVPGFLGPSTLLMLLASFAAAGAPTVTGGVVVVDERVTF